MTLSTPLALLTALVIPVIILLYMLKKRTRPETVSSLMLWQRLDRINTPALRLSRLLRSLLLALQILTAAVLVLALAQPVVDALTATNENTILILDTSMAMAVEEGGQSRLEQAKDQARSLINAKSPGDAVALIAMGEVPQLVSGFSTHGPTLLQAVEGIEVDSPRPNADAALALAANMADAVEDVSVLLFSAGNFGQLARHPEFALDYIALSGEEVENLVLEDVVMDGQRLYVSVYNNGTVAAAAEVEIRDDDGGLVGRRGVDLPPSQRQTLVWRNLPPAQWYKAEIVSAGDQLALDNSYFVLADGAAFNRLLLVSEGNLFLERALLLYPDLSVSRVSPDDYTSGMAELYDAFVMDGYLPGELPPAPVLVLDPPHPNPHLLTEEPVSISHLQPLAHPLLLHVDFSDVSISFAKPLVGGTAFLRADQGVLAAEFRQQDQPLIALGFALQAGDLPLRPAFPILLRNILDSLGGGNDQLPLDYGQPVPGGDAIVRSLDSGVDMAAGDMLTQGVYTIESSQGEMMGVVNSPRFTGSLVGQAQLETPQGAVQGEGQARRGNILLWPLMLAALVLMGLEWGVDNYGN